MPAAPGPARKPAKLPAMSGWGAPAGAADVGAHRRRRKPAIEDTGRPGHGVGRVAEADREPGKRELGGSEVDIDGATGNQGADGAGARVRGPGPADRCVRHLARGRHRSRNVAVDVVQVAAVVVNDLIAERLRNGRAWPLPASPVQAAAPSKAARRAFAADVDDGRRADAGDQPSVVERGHLSTATAAALTVRIC